METSLDVPVRERGRESFGPAPMEEHLSYVKFRDDSSSLGSESPLETGGTERSGRERRTSRTLPETPSDPRYTSPRADPTGCQI